MTVFRNVVFVAAIAGLLAGIAMAAMQSFATVPLPAMTMATPRRRRTTIARKPGPLPTVSSGSPIRWPPTW